MYAEDRSDGNLAIFAQLLPAARGDTNHNDRHDSDRDSYRLYKYTDLDTCVIHSPIGSLNTIRTQIDTHAHLS